MNGKHSELQQKKEKLMQKAEEDVPEQQREDMAEATAIRCVSPSGTVIKNKKRIYHGRHGDVE